MVHCEHRHYGFANLPPLSVVFGLHRCFISPPSICPPGHQHVVDCFCFPAASLGVFLKCWSFFCVCRLFSSASCESSESHCVFSHLVAENEMNLCFHFFLCLFPSEQLNQTHLALFTSDMKGNQCPAFENVTKSMPCHELRAVIVVLFC